MWLEVHFTVRRLERVTAKMLSRRNMSALLRTSDAQLSCVRSGSMLLKKDFDEVGRAILI